MNERILVKQYLKLQIVLLIICLGYIRCNKNTNKPVPATKQFYIENLGVTFGVWDKLTNFAGDFYFSHDLQKVFSEFGAQVLDPDWNIKELPTFDYFIKNNASAFSISEGEVVRMVYQNDTNDYEFSIRSLNDPSYDIVYDHLINIKIALGDQVQPGDTLGNPRPITPEIGMFEIMINNLDTKNSYCPFILFKEEKVEEYTQKVYQLMKDWEEFKGDTTIYDEENHIVPGCRYESMLSY